MCGILAVIGKKDIEGVKQLSKRMSHRGPDESGIKQFENGYIISHERLSIIDLSTGRQPIQGTDKAWVVHNGEIYNHAELRKMFPNHTFRTTCDSEIIVHLYEKYGYDICNFLDGDWAFVIVDGDKFMVSRDPIGVKPLYFGKDKDGNLYFSSEMKSLADVCESFSAFPPGYYYTGETGFVQYYKPAYHEAKNCTEVADLNKIREIEGHFIRVKDPIYLVPDSKTGRAQLYSSEKIVGKKHMDTYWFNILFIWITTLSLYLFLYFDLLKKLLDKLGDIKIKRG